MTPPRLAMVTALVASARPAASFGRASGRRGIGATQRQAATVSPPPEHPMEYTTLGDNLKVSKVCLGTMTWGQQNTRAEGVEQLDLAFDEYGTILIGSCW